MFYRLCAFGVNENDYKQILAKSTEGFSSSCLLIIMYIQVLKCARYI